MLLLGKLGWDVSGVTAFDFVDHLMERIDLSPSKNALNNSSGGVLVPSGSVRDTAAVLRGHALTYVSLCCTGTVSIQYVYRKVAAKFSIICPVQKKKEGGGCAFNQSCFV